jgi:hypothetical protein
MRHALPAAIFAVGTMFLFTVFEELINESVFEELVCRTEGLMTENLYERARVMDVTTGEHYLSITFTTTAADLNSKRGTNKNGFCDLRYIP